MTYQYIEDAIEDDICGYRDYEEQQAMVTHHRPAKNLRNTKQAAIAERLVRQQAIDEAMARRNRIANSSRAQRQRTQASQPIPRQPVDDNDEDEWDAPRIQPYNRRYDRKPGSYQEYYHQQPLRKSRAALKPPIEPRVRIHWHWLLYVGLSLFLLLLGYFALTNFANWWQGHSDDVTYGYPRTYQTDEVVGHNDSARHPSHFIAENLKGQIIVVEFPGGDATRARSYPVTTVPDGDTVPVRLVFQSTTNSGKLDMMVLIGDPGSQVTITLYNDGTQFVGKS